jgi:hypothetical protein
VTIFAQSDAARAAEDAVDELYPMTVRVGKSVLSIGFQPTTPVANPSLELDQIVTILKTIVPKLRGK